MSHDHEHHNEQTERRHPTVGYRFRSGPLIYLCTSWDRSCGFWMEVVEGSGDVLYPSRKVGDRVNVSERAIGRTYHRAGYGADEPYRAEHATGCNCFICEDRDV